MFDPSNGNLSDSACALFRFMHLEETPHPHSFVAPLMYRVKTNQTAHFHLMQGLHSTRTYI